MNPHEQSLVVAAEGAAARPQRQCTIKNNKENKETTKKNNVGSVYFVLSPMTFSSHLTFSLLSSSSSLIINK